MSIFFTADLHLGHDNIIGYTKRPFKDVDEMDNTLIDNYNEKVSNDDTVYILGDFTLKNAGPARQYLKRLNGHILIVPGGHDFRWLEGEYHGMIMYGEEKIAEILPPLFDSGLFFLTCLVS